MVTECWTPQSSHRDTLFFTEGGTREWADATPITFKIQYNIMSKIGCNTNLHIF